MVKCGRFKGVVKKEFIDIQIYLIPILIYYSITFPFILHLSYFCPEYNVKNADFFLKSTIMPPLTGFYDEILRRTAVRLYEILYIPFIYGD